MSKLGTLTIGQAPRADITPILDAVLDASLPRRHAGVLDDLSRAEIERDFATEPGQPVLITRLLDGSSVVIDRARTERAAQRKLALLEAEDCSTILMLCTGHFESLSTEKARLVEPDRILPAAVAALTQGVQLGIIVPLAEQISSEAGKWAPLGRASLYAAASPYGGPGASVAEAARELAGRGAEILLMDCMGFVERHRREAAEAGLPVILSNSLIAKLVSEIV
ncbi:AroM family protein [Bosea sp. F3-2]|uniref:AroM family protein n=1 Tax=Bosea sp. F3-2 TaxID=2599640 RepID=UPI0011EEA087|nr:AroM family protein [Bosea sp. F3-2]QEL24745.1 AroM family protein [Bosea sp. F3-2]